MYVYDVYIAISRELSYRLGIYGGESSLLGPYYRGQFFSPLATQSLREKVLQVALAVSDVTFRNFFWLRNNFDCQRSPTKLKKQNCLPILPSVSCDCDFYLVYGTGASSVFCLFFCRQVRHFEQRKSTIPPPGDCYDCNQVMRAVIGSFS